MKLTLAISLQDPIDINRVTTLKWTGRDNLNVFKHLEIRFFKTEIQKDKISNKQRIDVKSNFQTF